MKIRVTSQFRVDGRSSLEPALDSVMRQLMKIEAERRGLSEADITAALRDRRVNLSIVVNADSWEQAEKDAQDAFVDALTRSNAASSVTIETSESLGTELVPA